MKTKPRPMPAVLDPYKHIMENLMPLDPSSLEGVHSHVKAEVNDDGKIAIWVKDKHHAMEPLEAIAFARQVLEKATNAESEVKRRQSLADDVNGD